MEAGRINETLESSELFYPESKKFKSLLDLESFYGSGLYDSEYLERKRQYMYTGESYESVKSSITRSMAKSPRNWKEIAENGLSFLDLISNGDLMQAVFGDWFWRSLGIIKDFIGTIGGIHSVAVFLKWLLRKWLQRKNKSKIVVLDRVNYVNEKSRRIANLDSDIDESSIRRSNTVPHGSFQSDKRLNNDIHIQMQNLDFDIESQMTSHRPHSTFQSQKRLNNDIHIQMPYNSNF